MALAIVAGIEPGNADKSALLDSEEDNNKRPTAAYAFFQPLTEEQVKLAERMVKALPDGDTVGCRRSS